MLFARRQQSAFFPGSQRAAGGMQRGSGSLGNIPAAQRNADGPMAFAAASGLTGQTQQGVCDALEAAVTGLTSRMSEQVARRWLARRV